MSLWYVNDMAFAEGKSGARIGFFFICKDEKPFWTSIKLIKYEVRGKGVNFICYY